MFTDRIFNELKKQTFTEKSHFTVDKKTLKITNQEGWNLSRQIQKPKVSNFI